MRPLFGNLNDSSSSKNLVEFRAGKMHLKGTTVTADKRKGFLYLHQSDDSLMHFCWKDRTTGIVEDVSYGFIFIQNPVINYYYNFSRVGVRIFILETGPRPAEGEFSR